MTALAAAEKKKLKDEMYYRFNTGRGIGYWKTRMRHYDDAVKQFTRAIENAEPGTEKALLIARSRAHSRLVDHEAARRDADAVTAAHPSDLRGLQNDAFTLYEKDDFEDSLVRNYCGLRRRKKPDNFYRGILVGKETIEDCVGRNAGPCLDQDHLGKVIVRMHMKPRSENEDVEELAQAKRKYEKRRTDRLLSQKYLGRLANDKQFLQEMLTLPELKSGNKEHNQELEALLSHMLDNMNRQQETLMTQRPMYMLKHQEPRFSQQHKERRRSEESHWRDGVTRVIHRLFDEARLQQRGSKVQDCMNTCERLRRFVECQSSSLLSQKSRERVLDQLYDLVGELFMDTKTMVPGWSEADNERRIEFILLSRIDDPRFVDRVRQTYYPKIWNVKEARKDLEARLSVSVHKTERAFLYHEISRCLFEQQSTERAYKAASAGFKIAKDIKDPLWSFNLGFLTALAILVEGNTDDAKIAFRQAIINAHKLERDDCASFVQKVIKMIAEDSRLDYEREVSEEQHHKRILDMMPTGELKTKAQAVLRRVAVAPGHAKLQLKPVTSFRPVTQGSSRRSMKMHTRAKRRTLHEVKSSRQQNLRFSTSRADLAHEED